VTPGRPRVLFIGPVPPPITGQSLACQVFLDALRPHAEVEVVNLSKAGFRQGVDSGSRVREVLGIIAAVWRRRSRADLIYFTISESFAGNAKDLMIYLACLGRLDRTIVHLHGGAGMRELMRRGWLRRLNGVFLRRLGAVVVLGQRLLDVFGDAVPAERLRVVPNFAQEELFCRPSAIEAKFASTAPLRLLFLSNLLPGKGYVELVAAYASLDASVRERLHVDFAGGFESDADREAFLASISPHPQLTYHGTVQGDRKRALFANAHVFCLPTYYPYEGQPISILEAYASGCAVLTTDHSGIFDTFEPGRNGLAVEKRSVASLRQALTALAADPGGLLGMALHNQRTACARYTTERYNEALLETVLGIGPASPRIAETAHQPRP
jgi:glycosyltransferase involved in cell wall biosynthesis